MDAVAIAMLTMAFHQMSTLANEACVAESPCECRQEWRDSNETPDGFMVSVVDCSDRRFSAVPYFRPIENKTFDYLLLQNNRIAVVHTDAFMGLQAKDIDLSENLIRTIEDDAFKGLETELVSLNLQHNNLFHLPNKAVSKLHNLAFLGLVSGIRELRKDAFMGLTALRHLEFGNCLEIFYIHEGVFESIRETLIELLFHHCRFKVVPTGLGTLYKLENLRLPYNYFTKLRSEDFKGLDSITKLDLTFNRFLTLPDSFDSDTFKEIGDTLEVLDLTGIGLTKLPSETFQHLRKLKSLYLQGNLISQIIPGEFSPLSGLEYLYLNDNPLQYSAGMFRGLEKSLFFLQIGEQNLTELPLQEAGTLRTLRSISASGNTFETLDDGFTAGLTADDYHLGNCGIADISSSAFSGKSSQVGVVLTNNRLTNLNFVIDPCYFWRVDVSNNPINCDCYTYGLSKFPHLLLKGTCASPAHVKGFVIGGTDFDNTMFWRCKDHFFNATKLCSKWWVSRGNRRGLGTEAHVFALAFIVTLLRSWW